MFKCQYVNMIPMIPYFILETINIGPLTLHVWGAMAGLAFAAALIIALREARRKEISENNILDLAILILIGGVVGARLLFVAENWDYYSKDLSQILNLQEGGLMFYGGAIGAIILAAVYIKIKKLPFWSIADTVAPSLAIGEAIGRIGCTLTDLHIGSITALPWGQKYIDGSIRHPIALYMSLNGLILFAVLWFLRLRLKAEGTLFLFFLLWYSGTRFLLDFLRCKDLDVCDPHYFGFTPSQYISVLIFLSALIILFARSRNIRVSRLIFNLPVAFIGLIERPFNRFKLNFYPATMGIIRKTNFMEELKKQVGEKQPDAKIEIKNEAVAAPIHESEGSAKNKKVWSYAIILIIGLAIGAGALSGYYEKMFKSPIFAFRGKTWVSFEDPIIKTTIVNDPKCEACNTENVVNQLKAGIMPTMSVEEIDYNSQKGKDLISKFSIKSLPAFIFDSGVEKLKAFEKATPEQMNAIFIKKDNLDYLTLNAYASLGANPGRFLELPQVSANDHVKGPENAPVTIMEFSDFQCPYCKAASETMKQVIAAYPDKVRFVYKHLPIGTHPNAEFAAEAAECAGDQNKFWEMSDLLFANQDSLNKGTPDQYKDSVNKYADQLGLNKKDFESCLSAGKYKAKIEADAALANGYGIGGTPAFLINGELTGGAVTLDQFKAIIDGQLKGK